MSRSPRTLTVALCAAALALAAHRAAAQEMRYPYGPIVDAPAGPIARLSLGLVARGDVKNAGDFGLVEERADASLGYYRFDWGTFDVGATLNSWITTGGEIAGLPDQFGQLYLTTRWDYRTPEAFTFRTEIRPGMYSDFADFQARDFSIPFTLSGIQAFSEQFAAQLGIGLYPGFDRWYDPVAGFRWVPAENVRVDLFYPESQVAWECLPGWTALTGLAFHRTWDFRLEEKDSRERFRYEDTRFYVGADHLLTDYLQLMVRVGLATDRRIEFQKGNAHNRDVDDAFYFSVGVGGLL